MSFRKKKFNQESADRLWANYTEKLVSTISESEKEGLEKGYSSYQIEQLWQNKVKESVAQETETRENKKKQKTT